MKDQLDSADARGSLFETKSKFERIVSGRGSINSPRDAYVR